MREFTPSSIEVVSNNDAIILRNFYGLANAIKDIQQSILGRVQVSTGINITAGAGLSYSGTTLNVGTASASRIVVNADNIDLATSGIVAGTYTKITFDAYGRGTSGTTLADADIPSALTGKTYNGITLTALATGFSIAGGTSSRTLTVSGNANVSGTNSGDQTITLTGNVTGSGTGSFATTIAAGVVTLAMQANLAANSIIGNNTGSPATPIALTPTQVKTLLAITASDVSGLASIATSGSASDLSTGTVPAARMPALTGDVTTSAGTVATTIANNVVTLAKFQQIATASILGRTTAGTGNVEVLSASTTRTVLGLNTGDSPTFTNLTLSGTLGVSGQSTLAGITVNGGSSGQGRIYTTATVGLALQAIVGSSYDFSILGTGGIGSYVMRVPTGTTTAVFPNGVELSFLSSGRVPVTGSGGVITQDNLYWDATNDRLGIGSGATSPAGKLDLRDSIVGSILQGIAFNTDNTNTSSHARWQVTSGGSLGGDAYFQASINGVIDWAFGIDNSDSDAWVLSESSTLGTNNRFRVSSTQFRVFGNLLVDGTATFSSTITTPLTASLPVFTNGSSQLTTNAITGSGNVMMSASPTTTGTFTGAAANFSGAVSTGALTATRGTFSIPDNTTNAFSVYQGSDGYISIGTGNSSEEITIGNTSTNPTINFYSSNSANFYCPTSIDASLYIIRSVSFGTPTNIGALSTSVGSPTSYSAVDKTCLVANVDPGVGNSSYMTLTNGLSTQLIYLRNATGRSLYVTNGGSQVNPLSIGYNATLIYDGSTWQVYGTGI